MRDRPALLRTSSLWLIAMGALIALQAVEPSTPVSGGDIGSGPHDTYYVVAPFHFSLPFALVFALFAGFYLWCERAWGERYDDRLGLAHLGFTVGGVVMIFAPMIVVSFVGLPRSPVAFPAGFAFWSSVSTSGYLVVLVGLVVFAFTVLRGMWMALRVGVAH
jgi:cytochrome c oxidase subunit 1